MCITLPKAAKLLLLRGLLKVIASILLIILPHAGWSVV